MGDLSPSEHTELADWMDADPINKELYIRVSLRYKADLEIKDLCGTNEKEKSSFWDSLREFFVS